MAAPRGVKTRNTNSGDEVHKVRNKDDDDNKLRILSWNAAGMSEDSVGFVLDMLSATTSSWDAVLIQEGPKRDEEELHELIGGHLWFVAACQGQQRSVAILLNSRWVKKGRPRFSTVCGRLAQVNVHMHGLNMCLMTSHLPHSGYSDAQYEAALAQLEEAIGRARQSLQHVAVGVDANAVIGQQTDHDSRRVVGKWGLHSRNERGDLFTAFLHMVHLAASNTMFKKQMEHQWTHQLWSTNLQRQIDYILLDSSLRPFLRDSAASNDLDFKSDHRSVFADIVAPTCGHKGSKAVKKRKGNTRDLDLAKFHAALDDVLTDPLGDACDLADRVVAAAAASCKEVPTQTSPCSSRHSEQLHGLLQARALAEDPANRKHLTRQIWNCLTSERKERQSQRLDTLLEASKGKRELSKIMGGPKKKKRITTATDATGKRCTEQDEVLDVFAKFYEELYSSIGTESPFPGDGAHASAVSVKEVNEALKKLRAGKACGDDELCAEMLKTSHAGLVGAIATVFSDILCGYAELPATWAISRLVVLFKKGDATLPKNYRPIAIIPVLCKLFSAVLFGRVGRLLDSLQDPEQGGFRPDYSCSDIIVFMRMVAEKADEWGEEVWAASLDLEKAFDKVSHVSVLECLAEANVETDILKYLWRLYRQQVAYVSVDGAKSRLVSILRGVRQGDPLSPILFNNVTAKIFRALKEKWSKRGCGTIVCESAVLKTTHAMFADDTTLFASSRKALIAMIKDVKAALAEHGLNLNIDKCVVQTSSSTATLKPMEIDGQCIPMVQASEGFKVLGTQFTLQGRTSAEFRSRIGAAWGKFHSLWPVLGKRDGNLTKRLRLFDTCVTQTALWCSESWLLTQNEKRRLQSTQHCMLRKIAGPRRRPEETWVDWIQRSTRIARSLAQHAGVRMWLETHLQSKWRWAGHIIRMQDDRLAKRAVEWRDSVWWHAEVTNFTGHLRLRRPHKSHWFRWEDDLKRYAASQGWQAWQTVARRRDVWRDHCEAFINFTKR